jgi:hypothetical protein
MSTAQQTIYLWYHNSAKLSPHINIHGVRVPQVVTTEWQHRGSRWQVNGRTAVMLHLAVCGVVVVSRGKEWFGGC